METLTFFIAYWAVVMGLMGTSMLMLHKSSNDLSQLKETAPCDMGMVNCRLGMTGYLLAALGFALFIFLFPEALRQSAATWHKLGIKLSLFSIALGIIHYSATSLMYKLFR